MMTLLFILAGVICLMFGLSCVSTFVAWELRPETVCSSVAQAAAYWQAILLFITADRYSL